MKSIRLLPLLFLAVTAMEQVQAQKLNLLIGTYTKSGKSEGIYVYEFDLLTGKATPKNKATGIENPSYLTLSENEKFVYAVSESGPGQGAVSAFAFNGESGDLKFLNKQSSGGDGPCYVSTDKAGKNVFVANYTVGSFAALPIKSDGSLDAPSQIVVFRSNGLGKGQQEKPHAHSAVLSPDEKHLVVSDLGNDEILIYQYDKYSRQPLQQKDLIKLPAGNGPRHFEFHPNKKFAYSVQELTCDVIAYSYKKGKLSYLQSVSGLKPGYSGRKWAADIHISPDGKFLYSSNRDDANEIVIFAIGKDGKLSPVGRQSSFGRAPRNFVIDPSGNYLLAANQNSDTVVIFRRDIKTGLLTDTGERLNVGSPVCLKFAKID